MSNRAPALDEVRTSRLQSPREIAESLREVIACLLLGFQLTLEAYWTRIRNGRAPFSTTLSSRSRPLYRASLDSRTYSKAPFLRPTRNCDCNAPEIVALADEIRERTGGDWEYASAIFDFASNQIDQCFDFPPRRGVVETIERGFGTCHEKLNVLVALARAGGVPARYCTIGIGPGREGVVSLTQDDSGIFGVLTQPSKHFLAEKNDARAKRIVAWLLRRSLRIGKALETRARAGTLEPKRNEWLHYVAELQIGRSWIPADPTLSDEDCAAYNLPLQRFGYEPFLLGKLMGMVINNRSEAIPFRRRRQIVWLASICCSRGLFDHVNAFGERQRARGRKTLAEMGREAMIRRRRHLYRRIPAAVEELGSRLPRYPVS